MGVGQTRAGCFSRLKMEKLSYRKNVAGVLNNGERILLVKKPGLDFWQFVQGGIEQGEDEESALKREIKEETGIKKFKIIKKLGCSFRYDWNPELINKKGFKGQEQSFFIVKIKRDPKIKLLKGELEGFKWVYPKDLQSNMKYPPKIIKEILSGLKKANSSLSSIPGRK